MAKLEEMGFVWDTHPLKDQVVWDEMYKKLVAHHKQFGTCEITRKDEESTKRLPFGWIATANFASARIVLPNWTKWALLGRSSSKRVAQIPWEESLMNSNMAPQTSDVEM